MTTFNSAMLTMLENEKKQDLFFKFNLLYMCMTQVYTSFVCLVGTLRKCIRYLCRTAVLLFYHLTPYKEFCL